MNAAEAYLYARDIVKGRFPAGEAIMAQIPRYIALYAIDVIRGRLPEYESIIFRSLCRVDYLRILSIEEVSSATGVDIDEDCLFLKLKYGDSYVKEHLISLFSEKEHRVLTNPYDAYFYARDVVKNRVPGLEPVIAKSLYHSYHYAKNVIGGRFPLAENLINSDPVYRKSYEDFLKSIE